MRVDIIMFHNVANVLYITVLPGKCVCTFKSLIMLPG